MWTKICLVNLNTFYKYYITCNNCGEEYIGLNGTQINALVCVHHQQINDLRNTSCNEHFDKSAKGDYQVFPFYKLKSDSTAMRLFKENYMYFIILFPPNLTNTNHCIYDILFQLICVFVQMLEDRAEPHPTPKYLVPRNFTLF